MTNIRDRVLEFAVLIENNDPKAIELMLKTSMYDLEEFIINLVWFKGYDKTYKWIVQKYFPGGDLLTSYIEHSFLYSDGMKKLVNDHNYSIKTLLHICNKAGPYTHEDFTNASYDMILRTKKSERRKKLEILYNYINAIMIYGKQIKNKFPFPKDITKIICKMIVN